MPLYSYQCVCGNVFDVLKPIRRRKSHRCPCGLTARQIITPVAFDSKMGLDSAFTTAVDRFERIHKQKAKQEEKALLR